MLLLVLLQSQMRRVAGASSFISQGPDAIIFALRGLAAAQVHLIDNGRIAFRSRVIERP